MDLKFLRGPICHEKLSWRNSDFIYLSFVSLSNTHIISPMRKIFSGLLIFLAIAGMAQKTDPRSRKNGYVKKTDPKTNKVVYEGEFKNDVPVGRFKYYYPNDSVRAIMHFRSGGKAAYAWLFYMTGKRMAEGKYSNKDVKDSVWTYYDETGTLLSRETYKTGKKEGPSYVYLPDGGLSEESMYKDDILHGPFRQYFDGVNIRAQGKYMNGKKEGRVSYHYPNGVEVAAGYYKNGLKNGPWVYKKEDGSVKNKELFKNGEMASDKETAEFFNKGKN
jgi:antitoxin component YwqK of YwqJK toxin-antitoxin module